jgi:hypothetical protein
MLDAGLSPTLEDRPDDLAELHRLMQEAKLYFRGQVERARALSAELLEASPLQPPGPPRGRITARTLQQRREAAAAAEDPARVDLADLRMQVREHVTAHRLDEAARVLREIVALAERVPGFTGEAEQARRLLRRIQDPGG